MADGRAAWASLDPGDDPRLVWLRRPPGARVVFLLGAFDPPTRAHIALLEGATRVVGLPGCFCLTRVLLDRTARPLLPPERRLELLDALAASLNLGLAAANRGTYVDVAAAARRSGAEPVFVIGSDKLPQLEDPRFYPDGEEGVRRTFAEAEFLVVPRGGERVAERASVTLLEPGTLFEDDALADVSATEVRRRLARGEDVSALVPPVVALALAGYTQDSDSG